MDDALSRRRALATGAGLALGGTGLAVYSSQESDAAAVELSEWTVSDAEFDEPVTPIVDATIAWEYDVSEDIDRVRVELVIDEESLAFEDLNTSMQEGESTTDLSARVTDHTQLSASDFESGTETTIDVTARFRVYRGNEDVLAEDSATDSATVTVAEGDVVKVGGSATIEASE